MEVKYINPFIEASRKILQELIGLEPAIEAPALLENSISGGDLVVIIGLTGEVKGQVMFTLDESTALNIARKMTFDESLPELNEYAQSAISEMANMISGSTSMIMFRGGIIIDITPPSICKGSGMIISSKNKFVSIPLDLKQIGKFLINISFVKNEKVKDE